MHTTFHHIFLGITTLSVSLFTEMSHSAELGDFYVLGARPTQTAARIGAITLNSTSYQGSNKRETTVVPGLFLQMPNGLFADPFNGVGYHFETSGAWQYGARATFETGRDTNDALPGFDKIKARLNPGVYANYAMSDNLALRTSVRAGLGETGSGGLLNLGVAYKFVQAGFFSASLNASAKFANSGYLQSYYGVSNAQAAASGLARFKPEAGLASTQIGITAGTPLSKEIFVFGNVSMQRIMGDAANSPIVKKTTQPSGFVGVLYSF